MNGTYWKTSEIELLKKHFPKGGSKACMVHIKRSQQSIQKAARRYRIVFTGEA